MSTVPGKWTLTPLTHSICPLVEARLTSASWGECRVQIYFMSHLESTCSQLFLTIESQKLTFHMECLFLHTSHVCFVRKDLYNQQLTFFFRLCDTCNYLKTVIYNAFRYFMTVCAHSVIRPENFGRYVLDRCMFYLWVLFHSYDVPGCNLTAYTFWWQSEWMNGNSARFTAKSEALYHQIFARLYVMKPYSVVGN